MCVCVDNKCVGDIRSYFIDGGVTQLCPNLVLFCEDHMLKRRRQQRDRQTEKEEFHAVCSHNRHIASRATD